MEKSIQLYPQTEAIKCYFYHPKSGIIRGVIDGVGLRANLLASTDINKILRYPVSKKIEDWKR